MAKVGRASRNASLKRVETNDGTANKTIALAESGEVYIITTAPGAARTWTLPSAKEGGYFKLIFGVASDTHEVILKTAAADELLKGALLFQTSGAQTADDVQADGTDDVQVSIHDDVEPGSWVEVVSDGSHWYITGVIMATATPVFA
tara:strand:+ start:41 stop:481 length:441 start_codon:yes stop_codon:yes gene_type:complete